MSLFSPENPIKIVIADDHQVVRAGIRRLLSVEKSIQILDEASNGAEAIERIKYYEPDVALLDIFMPKMTGIEALPHIKRNNPSTFVIMLTAYEDSEHLEQALKAGADGYLSKEVGFRELIESVHKVTDGERVFSRSIIKILNKRYSPGTANNNDSVAITKREQQILNMIAQGNTNAAIAEKLNISVRTVESHRYNLMHKLDIKNTAELVRYAVVNLNMG
jgi:DNA-binding NarL/FixJ family response regulator